ncbi:MAG: N-acetyltransferase [Gammaproteobacteria bacterium]|nr:MAG: N-acetyltransferase [Gammaproteobacteria bacterium]
MDLVLKDITLEHTAAFMCWIADKQAIKYTLSKFLPQRNEQWVQSYILSLMEDNSTWDQTIIVDNVPIGYCGLSNLSKQNRSAEYFIIIGDRNYWNRGIGTFAGQIVLTYGFSKIGLHRIWLTVSEVNHGAIKSYESLGFSEEGRMKDACFRDGSYHDKIVMSILEDQWHNKLLKRTPE